MSLKRIHRLLVPLEQGAVFRSADVQDPRLGDLILPLEKVVGGSGVRCVIVGCPQHIGIERNGGRPGANEGPHAIRHALYRMATSALQDAVEAGRLSIADVGNIATEGKNLEQIHDELNDVVENLLSNGLFPIVLGGGHDCAWPTISAYEEIGKPYGLINIDAHADVRPLKDKSKAHSGSPFRQLLEGRPSALQRGSFVEFGLQHQAVAREHLKFLDEHGVVVMMLDHIESVGVQAAWREAVEVASKPGRLHITLDVDGFASAYAPGVSAPGVLGFAPSDVSQMLRTAARNNALTSFDMVEVSPQHDVDGRTSKLAATMLMEVFVGLTER